jgi:hypothetical protein
MSDWTRVKPAEPGNYWLCEDHWSDGETRFVRVFEDNDGELSCVLVGYTDSIKMRDMAHPSYWLPVVLPKPPVFADAA